MLSPWVLLCSVLELYGTVLMLFIIRLPISNRLSGHPDAKVYNRLGYGYAILDTGLGSGYAEHVTGLGYGYLKPKTGLG